MRMEVNSESLEIVLLLSRHFSGDFKKVISWLNTSHTFFYGQTPLNMINSGYEKKVLKFLLSLEA